MWITWDFIGPKLAGPSCAYVDVYAHLGDKPWLHKYGGYTWISQLDDLHLKGILESLEEDPRSVRRHFLPYIRKEIEFRESRQARKPPSVRTPEPFQLTLI